MNNRFFIIRQNILICTQILVLFIGFYYNNEKATYFTFSYFIILLISGNIRRLNYKSKLQYLLYKQ